jgi:hypothetical protein
VILFIALPEAKDNIDSGFVPNPTAVTSAVWLTIQVSE